jgi:hypothetical protein
MAFPISIYALLDPRIPTLYRHTEVFTRDEDRMTTVQIPL